MKLKLYCVGILFSLFAVSHSASALNSCQNTNQPGELGSHVQFVSLAYKTPDASDFTSVSNDGHLCVRFYTSYVGNPTILGVQLLANSNELHPEYPRGTIFRIKIKWDDTSKVFGAVQYRAANGRAYRVDEDGLSTISLEVESIHMLLSKSTLDQCTPDNQFDYQSYVDSLIYLYSRDSSSSSLGFLGSNQLVVSIRSQNFGTPSFDANGALNLYMDSCDQGEDGPDLFASGFMPSESLDAVGLSSAQIAILSDEQIQAAFTARTGSSDIENLSATFTKSYGEEISSDGLALSTDMQGIHFEVTAYKSAASSTISKAAASKNKLTTGQASIGLVPAARKALKNCLKKNGKKKSGRKLIFKKGKFSCKIKR